MHGPAAPGNAFARYSAPDGIDLAADDVLHFQPCLLKVRGFLVRGHEVYGTLKHEYQVLDLPDRGVGVLFFGVKVKARAGVNVVA